MKRLYLLLVTIVLITISACGGGGGGEESSSASTPPPTDNTPIVSPLAREIITYKQAVQQLTISNEAYHQTTLEFSQKDLSDGTIEQAKSSFESYFVKEEALLNALTAYNALVTNSAKPTSSPVVEVIKFSGECDASTVNGDILTEVANASPGLFGGVNVGSVISAANTIKTAREKIAILEAKVASGDIDDIDYMIAMKELQKQALKDGVKTGIGAYVGAGTGLVVGMVAGAAGLTVAPVLILGAAASYVAGTTFNMLFVNNTTQEVTTARVSAESAQFAVPDCSEGTLVISTDVLDDNDDSEPSPLIIENFATPNTGWSSRDDSEISITLPPAKPIEQVSTDDNTVAIEKTVSLPVNTTSCDDIRTIHINPTVYLVDKTATLSIVTQPKVSDCLLTMSGFKIIDSYNTPISEVIRTQSGGMYFHTMNGPQQGIMNASISVTAENGTSTALNHNFDFGLIPLVSITSESIVNVELGSTLTLSEMNVTAQYDDGSDKFLFDTDLTWEFVSGCGEILDNVFSAPETEICNATIKLSYVDEFEQTASTTFTIDVVPAFGITLIGLETDVPATEAMMIGFDVYVGRDDFTVTLSATGTKGYVADEKILTTFLGGDTYIDNLLPPTYLENPDIWLNGAHITITVRVTAPKTPTQDAVDITEEYEADWIAGKESPHKGNYSGAISGDDSGALSFTVDIAGYIQGTVYSNVDEQSYAVDGYVYYHNGQVSLGASGVSGWGNGNIIDGQVTNGTWVAEEGDSGTWTVTKQ